MLCADAKADGHAVELVRGQTGGATLASSSSRRRVEMDGEKHGAETELIASKLSAGGEAKGRCNPLRID